MKHPSHPFLLSITAAIVTGVALWLSRASFDVAGVTSAPIRVAMLPSVAELTGFVALALLIAAGMASLVRGGQMFWQPASDALLPLFALSLLVLPYLPWIADWVPALRLFAGPGRFLLWIVVLGQVMWVFLPMLARSMGVRSSVMTRSNAAALFGIVSVALSAPFILNVRSLSSVLEDAARSTSQLHAAPGSGLMAGGLGVLFDQEYGLVAYAPVLLLAFVGLADMLRARSHRWLAAGVTAVSLILIVLPASAAPWWRESMMPGRPVFLLLPVMAVPIAWLYARLEPGTAARTGAQSLLLVSIAVTIALVAFNPHVPAMQEGDGSSALLQWMSPTWHLWREAPSYVGGISRASSLRLLLWLTAFGIGAWILSRRSGISEGRAALATTLTGAALFVTVASVSSAVVPDESKRFDVEGRVMFPMLETYDPVARPIAIRYDWLSRVGADELPPLFVASAVPGQRTDRQPVRVVLNARFRLPAGRYVVDLKGSDAAVPVRDASMALQLGREGRPLESWPLHLERGQRSRHEFDVPLDAEFVGFRAARAVEQAIAELRVSPLNVVALRERIAAGTVLSSAGFPPARIFFHDSFAYPEAEGFWVRGRETVRMTLVKARETDAGILLAIHSGARPNVVTLATQGWSQKLELVPGVTQRVNVPSTIAERFISLTISSADGFVPAEIEKSRDRRLLGAWIAFIPDDIARTSAAP